MSGIFKGDSIYKIGGGGGGGYKDGGELVDGDFIKVENNSISTYTNTSRNDINYYFDVQNGDILNAVIELTNEYNATIHVYIVQNGLFIPIGNVGGDTVNAGDDYKINIVGNSFILEVVTPPQSGPEAAIIDGNIYEVVNINGILWTTKNFKDSSSIYSSTTNDFYLDYNYYKDLNIDGWRIPYRDELNDLITFASGDASKVKSSSEWSSNPGTNDTKLNFYPHGEMSKYDHSINGFRNYTVISARVDSENDSACYISLINSNQSMILGSSGSFDAWLHTVRLVKPL